MVTYAPLSQSTHIKTYPIPYVYYAIPPLHHQKDTSTYVCYPLPPHPPWNTSIYMYCVTLSHPTPLGTHLFTCTVLPFPTLPPWNTSIHLYCVTLSHPTPLEHIHSHIQCYSLPPHPPWNTSICMYGVTLSHPTPLGTHLFTCTELLSPTPVGQGSQLLVHLDGVCEVSKVFITPVDFEIKVRLKYM